MTCKIWVSLELEYATDAADDHIDSTPQLRYIVIQSQARYFMVRWVHQLEPTSHGWWWKPSFSVDPGYQVFVKPCSNIAWLFDAHVNQTWHYTYLYRIHLNCHKPSATCMISWCEVFLHLHSSSVPTIILIVPEPVQTQSHSSLVNY